MGIGAAVAHLLAMKGYQVWVADRNIEAAEETAAALTTQGYLARAIAMDVGDAESVAVAFEFIHQTAGRCDVLVNSAGVASVADFLEFPLAEFERTMRINVTGTLLCRHARGWHWANRLRHLEGGRDCADKANGCRVGL
jgi:NAD(P)-dependent dehydrogenase (short-subunit alcohol dehydrogenase family)